MLNFSSCFLVQMRLALTTKSYYSKLRHAQAAILVRDLEADSREEIKSSAIGRFAAAMLVDTVQEQQHQYKNVLTNKGSLAMVGAECTLQYSLKHIQTLCADFQWLTNFVEVSILEMARNCPELHHVKAIQQVRSNLSVLCEKSALFARDKIEQYLRHLFLTRGTLDADDIAILQALITFWSENKSFPAQPLALVLGNGKGKFRAHCIAHLKYLSENQVTMLLDVMEEWGGNGQAQDAVCIKLTDFLAAEACNGEVKTGSIVTVWKPVLYRMLKARGRPLLDHIQTTMKVRRYVDFLRNVHIIFGDKIVWNAKLSPPIMNPSLFSWVDRLAIYLLVLEHFESDDNATALRCLVTGADPWFLEGILMQLHAVEGRMSVPSVSRIYYAVAARLTSLNAAVVYDVLCSISQMTLDGVAACSRLLDLQESSELASTILSMWLQDSSWTDTDQLVMRDIATFLEIEVIESLSATALNAFADYINTRYITLLAEAKRLDYMRMDLKSRDHNGVVELLSEIMIKDTSAMEDAFARLPVPLLNVVEKIDDTQMEILFPLHDLTPLQRAAIGVGQAQSLILRLYVGDSSQTKFCIHLDNEPSLSSSEIHSQWTVFKTARAPEEQICHGTITPVTYQLARVLTRYLIGGFKDLLSIHTLVTTSLKTMGSTCIVCGKHHGVALRRATTCDAQNCITIFARAPIEIRLAAIRQDPLAVDMLLRMIHSAIQSGHHNLLPDCPLDKDACLDVLRTLPTMEKLAKSKYFSVTVRNWHAGRAELFLTWVCCSFKGFLTTATDKLRIPSLPPGTLQFVLANGAPMKELGFHTEFHANMQQSKVVFHGTSLDRLYPILHQGLKVMSGTPLQVYGAASGAGIYLADEPSTSWIYADRSTATRTNWSKSAIKNGRILLGCEMTSPSVALRRGGIHVVTKESTVMVRYIFVVPTETTVLPIANHLTSSMMSVFKSLRSGAL
jgi:hypothetical protein